MNDSTMRKLTVSEYSEEIGKSKQSIYNRIKRGTLKSDTIDGVTYVYIETTVDKPIKRFNQSLNQPLNNDLKNVNQSEDRRLIISLKSQLKEYKKLLKECKIDLKAKDKEIQKLNKKLNKEKDTSIEILKQFIGEMKALTHKNEIIEPEIIDDDISKDKKKKKKKKKK